MIGGKYRPRDVLGTGATGTVYSVEHTITGELLALKVMKAHLGSSADAIARFKREARAASKIRSQHVVRIFDADVAPELGGVPFLVMDLLEGSDLEKLSTDKPVDPEEVVEWLRQVALPLDKAHRIGIVHRDLKPENLFLTRLDDGTPLVKILDFGIARIAADSPGTTQSGQLFGTPLYMAPEQARGDPNQVGPPTDLFALGHIAYRLLTGVPYRTGTTLTEMLNEILYEPLRAPSERGHAFGDEFDRWFLRACQPDPALRFRSAHEQIEALARALGLPAEPEPARGPPPLTREHRPSQPDSGGAASSSLRAMAVEKNAALGAKGAGMPTLPVPERTNGVGPARKSGRRLAFVAILAVVAIPLLAVALTRRRSPVGGLFPRPSACAVDTAAAPVGPAEPPPVAPAVAQVGPTPIVEVARATTTPVSGEREAARLAPQRSSAAARAAAMRKALAEDDPLSDQQ